MRWLHGGGLAATAAAAALLAVPALAGPGMGWGQWTSPDLTFGECMSRAPAALRAEKLTKVEQHGRVWFGASPGPVSATIVCYGLAKGAIVTIFAANEGDSGPSGTLVGKLVDRIFKTEEPVGIEHPAPKGGSKTTTTPSTGGAGTFARPATPTVTNPNASDLKIDPVARTATWDHCCDGGKWKVIFSWSVPEKIVPGKPFSITLGIKVDESTPSPNGYQIEARAPDFAQAFSYTAQGPAAVPLQSKTYTHTLGSYASDPSYKTVVVTISFLSASVAYTYQRG